MVPRMPATQATLGLWKALGILGAAGGVGWQGPLAACSVMARKCTATGARLVAQRHNANRAVR